jgi:hypothetical protein
MNIRTLYRIVQSIENIISDIVDENVTKEAEVLELLIDAKRLSELLTQELNSVIKLYIEKKGVRGSD